MTRVTLLWINVPSFQMGMKHMQMYTVYYVYLHHSTFVQGLKYQVTLSDTPDQKITAIAGW